MSVHYLCLYTYRFCTHLYCTPALLHCGQQLLQVEVPEVLHALEGEAASIKVLCVRSDMCFDAYLHDLDVTVAVLFPQTYCPCFRTV